MKKCFILTFTVLLALSNISVAQKIFSYEKGKIITKTGDTIKCYIPISIYYGATIIYRPGEESSDNILNTSEIKFMQTPYNTFENISADNKEYLMRTLSNGKITLYSYIIPDEGSNPQGGSHLFSAPTTYYAIKKENSFYTFKEKTYKNILSEHLGDCPELIKKIGNKGYKFEDVEKIINEYNIYITGTNQ